MPTEIEPNAPQGEEKDRSTEERILHEAERGPTLPAGTEKPRPGQDSARGLQSGAEDDLTKPGNQTEDR